MGFPCGSAGKESICNAGDMSLIAGLGRSHGEGKGYPLQYSGLANSTDCRVHGVAKSWTRLSNCHLLSYIYVCGRAKSLHLYPSLCDPMDCSLPGFSVHGILQARLLEWVAISFFRGFSRPRDRTCVSHIS